MRTEAVGAWEPVFAALHHEWAEAEATMLGSQLKAWDNEFRDAFDEMSELKRRGVWMSGPVDLMTILDLQRDELSHSAMVAWLLTPTGTHGLGSRLLEAILESGWV